MKEAKKKKIAKNYPDCMPKSEPALKEWLENYGIYFPVIAPKYGFTEAEMRVVSDCINFVVLLLGLQYKIEGWLKAVLEARDMALATDPADPKVQVTFPAIPTWGTFPDPQPVNTLDPVSQSVNRLRSMKNLSDQDILTLRLRKAAPQKPRPVSAETLPYPFTTLINNNGQVTYRIKRGKRYRGKLAMVKINDDNTNHFRLLGTTANGQMSFQAVIPEGAQSVTLALTSVYMNDGIEDSQWSPVQTVTVYRQGPPNGAVPKQEDGAAEADTSA